MGKMPDRTDIALLEAWSDGSSDEAFAALARRYGGLLYHAALRRTGRDDLAGEAAQNSLLILARKAPQMRHLPSLAGWLHRTACYEASKLLRRESRHQARMKHLPLPDDEHGDSSWKDAAPLLDRALDELPEKDRQVIFLKYFEGLSFEQMARRFGGEPAAWRQRGSRAVERLRLSLTKRGAAVSATALATGLGTTFTEAAPTAFLATLPPASTAAAAAALSWKALTFHSLHLMKMKPAAVIAATLILALVPLGMQAKAISDTRHRLALLETTLASSTDPSVRKAVASRRADTRVNLVALADALLAAKEGDFVRRFSTEKKVDAMSADELERLLVESTTLELGAEQRSALVQALFRQFCRVAEKSGMPGDRVVALLFRLSPSMKLGQGTLWNLTGNNLNRWVNNDPDAAVAWYRENGMSASPEDAQVFLANAFGGLHHRNPDDAIAFFRSLTDTEKQALIGGGGGLELPELMLDLASKIGNDRLRSVAMNQVFSRALVAASSPQEVRGWIDRIKPSADEAAQLLASAAGRPSGEMSVEAVSKRIDWLREAGEDLDHSQAAGIFLAAIARSSPATAKEALDAEWQRQPDERALATYISRCMSNVELILDAIPRSRLITDPDLRDSALGMMLLSTRSEEEARELARKGGLAEEEIDRIIPRKP